jgi:hypothetical protein
VFHSPDGRDERKLLDTIVAKYRQCVAGALNTLVIHTVSDNLDEAARTLCFLAERSRPNLTAVVLMSSWSGGSRLLPNPDAQPLCPPPVREKLQTICAIDDEMWLPAADPGRPSLTDP